MSARARVVVDFLNVRGRGGDCACVRGCMCVCGCVLG